jgi:hypothetical protein
MVTPPQAWLSGKAAAVGDVLALVAGEDKQAIEGQLAFATMGANVSRLGLGTTALQFVWFAPPETVVSPTFLYSFFWLTHCSLSKLGMSDGRRHWQ